MLLKEYHSKTKQKFSLQTDFFMFCKSNLMPWKYAISSFFPKTEYALKYNVSFYSI